MRRAERLFELVQLLRSRRLVTADWLARELGVSTRTIYRDVADLQANGVPIQGEAGIGYRLHRSADLPPLTFNADEVEALVLGARMVEAWADPSLARAARQALRKVREALPPGLRDALTDVAMFVPQIRRAEVATTGLAVLRQGVAQRRKVHLHYVDAEGTETERTVRPLGLYFWGGSWTVAAWCELRQDYRTFRPDRMRAPTLLDARFGTDAIDLGGYFARMREIEEGTPPDCSVA